jgi:hypothetical protein
MLYLHLDWPKLFTLQNRTRGISSGNIKWFHYHNFGQITKHKGWEVQLDHWGWNHILDLELSLNLVGEDHPGFHLEFGLFGFTLHFDIRDDRHWNCKENRFYLDGEEEAEWQAHQAKKVETGAERA